MKYEISEDAIEQYKSTQKAHKNYCELGEHEKANAAFNAMAHLAMQEMESVIKEQEG